MIRKSSNCFILKSAWLVMTLLLSAAVFARGEYQTPEAFLNLVFNQSPPKSHVVWLRGDVRKNVNAILGHNYAGLRIRYWQEAKRSAWILDEIGKEEPITFGIVVADNKVEQIKILNYRESRGDEIRYPAFTQQFSGASLDKSKLDRHIDGISGATLSVRAMTNVARLALYLDRYINKQS